MNDVRNLMDKLQGDVEYREFQNYTPGSAAGSWPVLERLARPAAPAPVVEDATVEAAPPLADKMLTAAEARAERGLGAQKRLSLGKYSRTLSSAAEAGDARRLPLEEVFARLAASPRA